MQKIFLDENEGCQFLLASGQTLKHQRISISACATYRDFCILYTAHFYINEPRANIACIARRSTHSRREKQKTKSREGNGEERRKRSSGSFSPPHYPCGSLRSPTGSRGFRPATQASNSESPIHSVDWGTANKHVQSRACACSSHLYNVYKLALVKSHSFSRIDMDTSKQTSTHARTRIPYLLE